MINTEIIAKAIVFFKRLDYSLGPFERLVFFRLWLRYFDSEIDLSQTIEIAKEIGVHSRKLENAISILIAKGMLDVIAENAIKVNSNIISGNQDKKNIHVIMYRLETVERYSGLLNFIYKILNMIYKVRISHKQGNIDELLRIDYKAWLVLFCLLVNSDENGIVLRVGMHEMGIYTGMDRYSILRSLNKLFSFGVLRSKINGTLDNSFLCFTSAIYLINLSHPLWGEYRQYRKYIFIKTPSSESLLDQALDVVGNLKQLESWEKPIHVLSYIPSVAIYQFEEDHNAVVECMEEFNFVRQMSSSFEQKANLSKFGSQVRLKKANNTKDNLKRLEFVFKYIAKYLPNEQLYSSSKIRLFEDLALYQNIHEFQKYFSFDDLVLLEKYTHENSKIPANELMQILKTSQLKFYTFITQYLLKNEALHLIDTAQRSSFEFIPIPLSSELEMSGYITRPTEIEQDELYLVTFENEAKGYKKVQTKIEMTVENQKVHGLLDQSCDALVF